MIAQKIVLSARHGCDPILYTVKYIYFPMVKYKYDNFQIVKLEFVKFDNANLIFDTHVMFKTKNKICLISENLGQ